MKPTDKIHFKKMRDRKKRRMCVSMSPHEQSLLDSMMQQEGWGNMSGFVKHKLFRGTDVENNYKRAIANADKELLKKMLVHLFDDLVDQLTYVNARLTQELIDMRAETAMVNSMAVSKWMSLLARWVDAVEDNTEMLFRDCVLILRRLDAIGEQEKLDYLKTLPDSVLLEHVNNWNDTSSPEYMEYLRRLHKRINRK